MKSETTNSSRQERSDKTRRKILRAAIKEFSAHGLAGARTETIARSAKVNTALLYYHFKSKEMLYIAAIEDLTGKVIESTNAVFDHKCTAGEHLLRLALNHFDRILTQHDFQSLMQQEMIRFQSGKGTALPMIARAVFIPLLAKIQNTIRNGIRTKEIIPLDWTQVIYSGFGANVFYFLSAPIMQAALKSDPFSPATLTLRRKSAVQFLANALFVDRAHGQKLARRVLAAMPLPEIEPRPRWRKPL